jgi:hypothetical protein
MSTMLMEKSTNMWRKRAARIYREGYSPGLFRLIAGWWVVLAVVVLAVAPPSPWLLILVPFYLGMAGILWQMSRMGVQLDDNGVKVMHMFRSIRIPWSRFSRFVVLPRPRDWLRKTGFVEQSDGSLVWIQGMAPWFVMITKFDDFTVDAMIAEMNREARKLKQATLMTRSPDRA